MPVLDSRDLNLGHGAPKLGSSAPNLGPRALNLGPGDTNLGPRAPTLAPKALITFQALFVWILWSKLGKINYHVTIMVTAIFDRS